MIPDGLTVVAGGALTLAAAHTTTGTASAGGSATSTGTGSIAVGAGVALNLVKADAEATIGYTAGGGMPAGATVAATGLSLQATMNGPGTTDTFGSMANAGAGASKVGVAGALALNSSGTRTRP